MGHVPRPSRRFPFVVGFVGRVVVPLLMLLLLLSLLLFARYNRVTMLACLRVCMHVWPVLRPSWCVSLSRVRNVLSVPSDPLVFVFLFVVFTACC